MLELGIDVSLATDGGACANTEDMLEAMKFGLLMQKSAAQDPRVLNARDILRLATVGGAHALALPADLGALEVGRLADFFLFDPYRLKSVPMHEPLSTLVYAGEQSNVDTVVIDGKVVLEAGRFTSIDEEAFVREVHDRALSLSQRIGTFRLAEGRRFTPFGYDRIRSDTLARSASAEHTGQTALDNVDSGAATPGEGGVEPASADRILSTKGPHLSSSQRPEG
jgi:5-methylthioadenosine/S-adenosylhomocysteine deaminase